MSARLEGAAEPAAHWHQRGSAGAVPYFSGPSRRLHAREG